MCFFRRLSQLMHMFSQIIMEQINKIGFIFKDTENISYTVHV